MKNAVVIIILLVTLNLNSQNKREQIKALKIAFITDELQLTETEAQGFWPIYNAFEESNNKLRHEAYRNRKNINFETLSEKDAKDLLSKNLEIESKRNKLQENLINDLLKILPAKKIVLLKKVEDDFNKRMFEEFKKRRKPQ